MAGLTDIVEGLSIYLNKKQRQAVDSRILMRFNVGRHRFIILATMVTLL
ncbi:hypothetical protein [Endozoicomonas sp. ALD040]